MPYKYPNGSYHLWSCEYREGRRLIDQYDDLGRLRYLDAVKIIQGIAGDYAHELRKKFDATIRIHKSEVSSLAFRDFLFFNSYASHPEDE